MDGRVLGAVLGESTSVPLLVVSRHDEHLAIVNATLRQAGHAVHCQRLNCLDELGTSLAGNPPELILFFTGRSDLELPAVVAAARTCAPTPPILLVQERVDERAIAAALEAGARDVVSLTHRHRFTAVAERELQAHRLRLALEGVLSSASEYKQELRNLMNGTSEAIADVQEGIVVAANPAFAELFGPIPAAELAGQPIMDLFHDSEQTIIKGALVACLKDRWHDEALRVTTKTATGQNQATALRLARITLDGQPAVRLSVPRERAADRSSVELLEQAVSKDPSTGLLLRHHFLAQLQARLQQPLTSGIRALAYIRPDHFARVHHDVGLLGTEALLMRLAELLGDLTQPNDLYGRFGGTIFVAALERGTVTDAEAWAEQLCRAVAARVFEVDAQTTSLTVTIGLCEIPAGESDVAALIGEAERACRNGRDQGGNRVTLSDTASATQKLRQLDALWVPRLREALVQNRLRLVHQPVVALHEEAHGLLDTRVQMVTDAGDIVRPGDFIPAAERAGMIRNIDRWVVAASLSFCAARQPRMVFVKLSRDSVVDNGLLDWLRARLASGRARPEQLCFQVGEDVATQHLRETQHLARGLAEIGTAFAVDQLGTGRHSLQVLEVVPMQFAKIDGSLMQGLHRDDTLQQKVSTLVQQASARQIRTIAQRVENANTMAVLWQLGVTYVQGHFAASHGVVLGEADQPKAVG